MYRVLKRTIERGGYDTEEMREKLDVFYAADRITQEQYTELVALLG